MNKYCVLGSISFTGNGEVYIESENKVIETKITFKANDFTYDCTDRENPKIIITPVLDKDKKSFVEIKTSN